MLSLRLRLFTIILAPLILIAAVIGLWRLDTAQSTAQQLYDRSLLFTALAVSRDVALLDGDAISAETEKLLGETAGGPVKYHVYAPDGVFVTGYAVPPVPLSTTVRQNESFSYFDAVERGTDVRVLRLEYVTQIGGFSGPFTVTVWQNKAVRQSFVNGLARRALAVILVLIGTTAVVVWFGVNLGLKPLLDLEEAISRRTPEDLGPIRRAVPAEVEGLVDRLNRLFALVSRSMEAQAAFISDAAHQLRNPIAGLRALGESILTARSLETAQARAADLVAAAQDASALAEALMTLERARAASHQLMTGHDDLGEVLGDVIKAAETRAKAASVALNVRSGVTGRRVLADETMLREAIKNLLNNAFAHGGPDLSRIDVSLASEGDMVAITVQDDGRGVPREDFDKIRARFGLAATSQGSGLGLSIAEAVANSHGGRLRLNVVDRGFSATLLLPCRGAA